MHRRQQTDSVNSKVNYQVSSPYIELLQSKKKVYGHKYENKNNRSFTGNVKPSPAGTTIFSNSYKPFKSVSSEKSKAHKSTNTKKKRNHTEQIEQKMHESLYVQMNEKQKPEYNASKSLFYGDQQPDHANKSNSYFHFLGHTGKKNTRKRYLSENRPVPLEISMEKQGNSLEGLKITDIDSLILLIDNCVQEANDYISYLSQKIQSLKEQLILAKASQNDLQIMVKNKEQTIKRKDRQIIEFEKQIKKNEVRKQEEMPYQVKNLLQVIERMNEENSQLKKRLEMVELEREGRKGEKGKDYYNQIHSNIDILNISIGSKEQGSPPRAKDLVKKFKFIKPKQK